MHCAPCMAINSALRITEEVTMLEQTANRVQRHTSPRRNEAIRQHVEEAITLYQGQPPEIITRRLAELDREWDIERMLQTNFAVLSLVGVTLTASVHKRWAWLALGVPAFMVQHALQGWCPPLPVLRRLGFRTAKEINDERFALKALRGDFDEPPADANALLATVKG